MAGATRLGPASTAVSYTLFGRKVPRSGFQERTKGAMNLDGKLWRPYRSGYKPHRQSSDSGRG